MMSMGECSLVKLVGVTNVFLVGSGVLLLLVIPLIRSDNLRLVVPAGMGVFGGVGLMASCVPGTGCGVAVNCDAVGVSMDDVATVGVGTVCIWGVSLGTSITSSGELVACSTALHKFSDWTAL